MERVYLGPLLDKLGIRPGMRVALIEIDDAETRALLAGRTNVVSFSPTHTALRLVIPVARRPK